MFPSFVLGWSKAFGQIHALPEGLEVLIQQMIVVVSFLVHGSQPLQA